jgi:hypothetical protein
MIGSPLSRLRNYLASRNAPPIVSDVLADSLTYLSASALNELYGQVRGLEARGLQGMLIEAGCALGGSAIVIATAKSRARPFFVYDVFGMIPPPSERDDRDVHDRYDEIRDGRSQGIDGQKYYGYEENLFAKVQENFRRHGVALEENDVHLVQGLFQDTLHVDAPVALAHLDGDWYDSIMTCLQRIAPHLAAGGVLVVDDYYAWSGCRKAVDEYFKDKHDRYRFVRRSRLHIIRQ